MTSFASAFAKPMKICSISQLNVFHFWLRFFLHVYFSRSHESRSIHMTGVVRALLKCKVKKKNERFSAVCSRCRQNLKFGHFRLPCQVRSPLEANYLPSHMYLQQSPALQLTVCVFSPTQSLPSLDGDGLSHDLTRILTPNPQDLVQALHDDHSPQFPSSVKTRRE